MNNERAFFEQLANAGQPGWCVKLQPHLEPGSMHLAGNTALIYVVDTSTGWTAAGAMPPASFIEAARWAAKVSLSIADMAGKMITKLGKENPDAGTRDVAQCIELTAAALTNTQTYKMVQATGDLAGHWVYIAYQAKDGSTIARPIFFRTGSANFLDPDELSQVVRQIAAQDTGNTKSSIGQLIKKAGGARLSSKFRIH